MSAQERMREEYSGVGAFHPTFSYRLKRAGEEGVLLFAKWGLVAVLAYLVLAFGMNVVSGASNGTTAILYLNQMIEKGYLPKAVNGQVPERQNETSTVVK